MKPDILDHLFPPRSGISVPVSTQLPQKCSEIELLKGFCSCSGITFGLFFFFSYLRTHSFSTPSATFITFTQNDLKGTWYIVQGIILHHWIFRNIN